MSEKQSSKSITNITNKDNNNNNSPIIQNNLVPNQQSIKMEVLQFKDEVLRELKLLKKSISEKYESNATLVSEKLSIYDNKISLLNERIIELSGKINTDNNLKNDMSTLIEFKNRTRDNLLTMEIKINNIDKEMKNNVFRIDNILSDSVIYPGIIGKSCKFKTFHNMLDHLLSQTSQTITYREKNTLDLNTYKKKLESIVQNLQSQKDSIIDQNNNLINKKMDEIEEKFKSLIALYDERLSGTRAENATYMRDMQETVNKFKDELIEFEKLKGRIFEEIRAEGRMLRLENEKTQTIFLGYKKEFNLLKDRFTQLSEFIKDVRFRINMGQEVKRREYYQMSSKLDFSKKQKIESSKEVHIMENDIKDEIVESNHNKRNSIQLREINDKKPGFFSPDNKNKMTRNLKKDRHYTVNHSKSKRFLQNKSNISLNKGNIKDITKYKINKITDRNEQTNNLSSIDSESQEKNLLEFNEESEMDNKNKNEEEIINLKKHDINNNNNNNNVYNHGEEKDNIKKINNNDKKRNSITVRSVMDLPKMSNNKKNSNNINNNDDNDNKSIIEKEEKQNNINEDKKIEEISNSKIKIIYDNNNTNIPINIKMNSNNNLNANINNLDFRDIPHTINNKNNNNNNNNINNNINNKNPNNNYNNYDNNNSNSNDTINNKNNINNNNNNIINFIKKEKINNNNIDVYHDYINNINNNKINNNQISNNNKNSTKTFNGLANNKEENIKNEEPKIKVEQSLLEEKNSNPNKVIEDHQKVINTKNTFSSIHNSSSGNNVNNIIESKKNSKIYSSPKTVKKNLSRTQSALNNQLPNINNNMSNLNKKQQTLRPSSSANDFFNYRSKTNHIMDSSDKNSIILSKANYQNPYEEDKKTNINNNVKKKNNINSEIYFVSNNGQFRANKIRSNLSPNVQILQYGIQHIYDNNNLDRQNRMGDFNKNYINLGNNKKTTLNNTEYNYNKNKNFFDKNDGAKNIQGMINNLQSYIKGYNSNLISQNELKEERKKFSKNSSYYKIKEIVNDNHPFENKKNNDVKISKKRNIVEIGFNEYK